jgi:hypothetical protein
VLQALDAQVAQNTTAMTGVQTADGSCMTVRAAATREGSSERCTTPCTGRRPGLCAQRKSRR